MALTTGTPHDLYDSTNPQAAVVAHLEQGAMGQITACAKDWCKLKFEGVKGYLHKSDFWGAEPGEVFD